MKKLTTKQYRVLAVMSEIDGLTLKEISEESGYNRVWLAVSELKKRGLIYSERIGFSVYWFLTKEP